MLKNLGSGAWTVEKSRVWDHGFLTHLWLGAWMLENVGLGAWIVEKCRVMSMDY